MLGGRSILDSAQADRLWNLGRYGLPCNLVACFFVVQSIVIYCFPATQVSYLQPVDLLPVSNWLKNVACDADWHELWYVSDGCNASSRFEGDAADQSSMQSLCLLEGIS